MIWDAKLPSLIFPDLHFTLASIGGKLSGRYWQSGIAKAIITLLITAAILIKNIYKAILVIVETIVADFSAIRSHNLKPITYGIFALSIRKKEHSRYEPGFRIRLSILPTKVCLHQCWLGKQNWNMDYHYTPQKVCYPVHKKNGRHPPNKPL